MGWFIWEDGHEIGPLELDALTERIGNGSLSPQDLMRREDQASWRPASSEQLLSGAFATDASPASVSDLLEAARSRASKAQAGDLGRARIDQHRRRNWFNRYWRGGFALPLAFWLIAPGSAILWGILNVGVFRQLDGIDVSMQIYGICMLLARLLTALLAIWLWVGLFRTAERYQDAGGSKIWASLARLLVLLGGIGTIFVMVEIGLPVAEEAIYLARGIDRIPASEIRLLSGGTEIELSGGLSWGTAHRLEVALTASPAVNTLHLNSIGGRVREANLIMRQVRDRHLITYTATECDSACTLIFVAGRERYLANGARLGFHSMSIVGTTQKLATATNDAGQQYTEAGLSQDFVARVMATPGDDIWYPRYDELTAAHVITGIVDPKRFGVSGLQQLKDASALEAELLKFSAFKKLKQYDSRSYQIIVDRMISDLSKGTPPLDIQGDLIAILQQRIIPPLIAKAPDEIVRRFTHLAISQLEYVGAHVPQYCPALLFPDSKTKIDFQSLIPPKLMQEGIDLMADLVEEASLNPYTGGPDPEAPTKLRAIATTFFAKSPLYRDILQHPAAHHDQPAVFCAAATSLYDAVLNDEDATATTPILRFMLSDHNR